MLFQLVRPMRRKDSRIPQFVKRIPADLAHQLAGKRIDVPLADGLTVRVRVTGTTDSIRFSLRTDDPAEAKIRHANAAAYIEGVFRAYREHQPASFSHEQAVAFSKRMYEGWASGSRVRTYSIELTPDYEQRPEGEPKQHSLGRIEKDEHASFDGAHFEHLAGVLTEALASENIPWLEENLGAIIDRQLLKEGIVELERASRPKLLLESARAMRDAFALRKRQLSDSNYAPDPMAERFPVFKPPGKPSEDRKVQSLTKILEDWWVEAKATGLVESTYESYRNTMANFVAFLGHDDASRVTAADVIRFKDHRLASINPRTGKPISPKTVKDSDLAGLKAVFRWAVTNQRIAANPAQGVTIKLGRPQKLRSKAYSDAEAIAILEASLKIDISEKPSRTNLALRWVPWLMAYSGARVGEFAQLRQQDLRREGEHWVLKVTPEAGRVKNKEARDVVLHPQLVAMGFPEFVNSRTAGYLFVKLNPEESILGSLKGITNRLASFARGIVKDKGVAPNHGWRHRFKTIGRAAGIDNAMLNAIDGHAPETVGDSYGDTVVEAQAKAMAKIPWFPLK